MSSNNSNKKIEISPLLSNNTQNISAISSQYTNSRNNLQRQINNITSEKNSEHLPLVSSEQNMSTIGAGSGPGAMPPQTTTNQTLSRNNRRRQMNRSRQNIVLYQSDIDWAVKTLVYALEKKEFNLAAFQKSLLFGSPDEAYKAKKELKSIQYVLRKLKTDYKFLNNIVARISPDARVILGRFGFGVYGAGGIAAVIAISVLTAVTEGGFPLVLVTTASIASLLFSASVKLNVVYDNANELLTMITKILNDEKKVPIDKRVYLMSNQNIPGNFKMSQNPLFSGNNTRKNNNRNNTNNKNNNKSKRRSTIKKQYSPTTPNFYKKNKFSF